MRTFSLLSQKGGVGKTTLALHMAMAFAQRGLKTLLVDADPQGAVGLSLRGSQRNRAGLGAVLLDGVATSDARIYTKETGLSLLPMGKLAPEQLDPVHDLLGRPEALQRALEPLEGDHDLVIIDTPAGLHGPAIGAACATGRVLVPVQCEPLSIRTLSTVLERIGHLRERGHSVELLGVVLTMSSFRDATSLAVLEEAWSLYPSLVLETHVPRDVAFARASAEGVPVGLLSRRPPPVAAIFDRLCAELEPRLGIGAGEMHDEPRSLLD